MLNVKVPLRLHENQQMILDSTALNVVVKAGKRFGKRVSYSFIKGIDSFDLNKINEYLSMATDRLKEKGLKSA